MTTDQPAVSFKRVVQKQVHFQRISHCGYLPAFHIATQLANNYFEQFLGTVVKGCKRLKRLTEQQFCRIEKFNVLKCEMTFVDEKKNAKKNNNNK
ncbi:hypothetical protein T03_15073 [Trichinella britovi]|uniref:Uncharacterized protein n=1 Tax=Trichinella britovi TaxID=45882 RepID=A0A0V1CI85_TRIBR|nr:hypothetical protein T03_15073 [Trichinella britovi]